MHACAILGQSLHLWRDVGMERECSADVVCPNWPIRTLSSRSVLYRRLDIVAEPIAVPNDKRKSM